MPDHIGCGFSDKPDDHAYDYTLARRAQDLEALVDATGIGRGLTLVLHDWGGMIGMTYATRHPEAVKRLVILNTAAFHLPEPKRFPRSLALARNTLLGAFLVRRFNAFSAVASRVACTRRKLPRAVRRAYQAPYDSWAHRIATLRFVQDIPLEPSDPSYGVVSEVERKLDTLADIPMLICWGMKDFVFDAHFLAEWERRFPRAQVHRFEDAGHYVLEEAREQIVPLVQDFLAPA